MAAKAQFICQPICSMIANGIGASGGSSPVETFRILAEDGSILNAENDDKLNTEELP